MQIDMVFNDLSASVEAQAADIYAARKLMHGFVETIVAAAGMGIGKSLRTQNNFYSMELAPNYTLANWFTDNEVSREERSFLRSLSTKTPYLAGLEPSDIVYARQLSDFYFQGLKASGLGVGYLLDGLAVSILSSKTWDRSVITLKMEQLNERGDIDNKEVSVKHAAKPKHLSVHRQWIAERRQDEINDSHDLWHRRKEFFPFLQFCEHARDQIIHIKPTNPIFRQIKKRLFEFQNYCQAWNEGPFMPDQLPCKTTTESSGTLKKYVQQRTFRCPDGIDRVFSWHVRVTPGAWRVYFYPAEHNKTFFIGYIGPHLQTVSEQ